MLSAQHELTHAEGQSNLTCVGVKGSGFEFWRQFCFFSPRLVTYFFLILFYSIDIVMVENVVDDGVEPKPAIIESSVDVKYTIDTLIDVKISTQASVEEKSTGVSRLHDNEVNTASFFSFIYDRWKDRDDLLGWVCRQVAKAEFTISIDKSSIKNSILTLHCERSGVYRPPKTKKKLNLEGTGSRKCDCPFRIRGYFEKKTNDWWLAILNGVHNHELKLRLDGHILPSRLREEEKKRVVDMKRSWRCLGIFTRI